MASFPSHIIPVSRKSFDFLKRQVPSLPRLHIPYVEPMQNLWKAPLQIQNPLAENADSADLPTHRSSYVCIPPPHAKPSAPSALSARDYSTPHAIFRRDRRPIHATTVPDGSRGNFFWGASFNCSTGFCNRPRMYPALKD